jgi:predicted transcriptional regulator
MKMAILKIQSFDESLDNFARAWRSGLPEAAATIAFATPELARDIVTPERWHILKSLCGAGAVTTSDIARRVGRDADSVNADVAALLSAGVLERGPHGVTFPYDEVSLDLPTIGRDTV